MPKKGSIKMFFDEIYSKPPKKNYPSNKITYNHLDEIWSIDLADMIDYKTSNIKGNRYILVIIDNFSTFVWCIPLKNKHSQTITHEFSNIITTSKRRPLELESDRGADFYNSIFQKFLKSKIIHHYYRFTDKGPSLAERVIRTMRNLLKKPIFSTGNADWLSELPSTVKKYNNTFHSSTKMTPLQASKKSNQKEVYLNLIDKREFRKPKYKLGQLFSTADIKRVFSKGDSTNYSYKLYPSTEVIHYTIPSYRNNYMPGRFNETLLLPTKLSREQNKVMEELILIQ